jgi:hypothetical protein
MNPVRVALATILKEDKELQKLVTGIFHREPADDAAFPYVIFFKMSGVPTWTFGGPSLDNDVWLVKGIGSRDDAEAIDTRLKQLLNGATLAIKGKVHQDLRAIGDVDYPEVVKGERVDHVGAEYKLDSEYE